MESTIDFKVNEGSLQEFADKWFATEIGSEERRSYDKVNPYSIIGRDEILVKKEIMSVIENDPTIKFTLSDRSRRYDTKLINTYQYSIETYDDVCLKLKLIDFDVALDKD